MLNKKGHISGTASQLEHDGTLTNGNVLSEDSGIGSRRSSDEKLRNGLDVDSLPKATTASGKDSIAPIVKKYVKLRHVGEERPVCSDTLHTKCLEKMPCSQRFCTGSIIEQHLVGPEPRPREEMLVHARDFINQYYQSIKSRNTPAHTSRLQEVEDSVQATGTYEPTTAELTFGAKTAWRNSARCIGRIQWSKLQVFDARHITTARGMFEAICNHIKYGTNKGNIRSAFTLFPPRTDGKHDFRVWNSQFIRYAGYRQEDGSVVGDPSNIELTDLCQQLGWKGKGTRFDVLPLLLQANGHDPEVFEIPPELVLEVNIKHPQFPWFADMGLKWYAVPAVANMVFDCGGLLFTAAPFNGWYMGTEIGARNFCDPYRYNLLEDIAKRMGLDTRMTSSLWKDRTLVEINVAVLHSYQSQGVTITDHHTASESFIKHLENEQKLRGGCPADWVWVVPPMSGSLTSVFHQEMLNYKLHPSFEYQADAWKTHVWKKYKEIIKSSTEGPRRKIGFRELARAVQFSAKLMMKALARRVRCVILYATETGKSEGFAKSLCQLFKHAFDVKVYNMQEYDVTELEHVALVLIVTSTFGNGDPPENGESFAKYLLETKHKEPKNKMSGQVSYLRTSTALSDESGSEPAGDQESTPGSETFGDQDSTPGSEPSGDQVSTPGSEPSGDQESTPGSEPSGDQESKPGSEPSGDQESTPGSEPSDDQGSTPGSEPSGDQGSTPGSETSGEQESTPGSEPSGDQVSTPGSEPSGDQGSTPGSEPSGDQESTTSSEYTKSVDGNLTLETGPLSSVRFSVFGLGSSAYPKFCAFAHYVDTMFASLGAERIHTLAEGDVLCGQEESFRTWAKDVFKAACATFCTGDDRILHDATCSLTITESHWTPDRFRLTPATGSKAPEIIEALSAMHGKNMLPCRFIELKQLQASESDRQTLLIKLDATMGSGELLYHPGDHVAIFSENSASLVDAILVRLQNAPPPDQLIKIEVMNERSTPMGNMTSWDTYGKLPVCSLRTALTRYLDITTPPSRALLKLFATQATKDCDRDSLEKLANEPDAYENWKFESYPNIVHVLDEFPSLRVPASLLLTQLPVLQSRFYSISSSPKLFPGEIHATIAVVMYRTQGKSDALHEGVCSNWLNRQEEGNTIPCLIRHAPAFHMPDDPTVPIILVGPGTGIAPFRSFWQQRKIDMEMLPKPQRGSRHGWGAIDIYFGCRNIALDAIYRDELQQMKADGVLREVYTALSREPNVPKTYVQSILTQNSANVFRCIVKECGHFYVCGDVKMAFDVTTTLEKILASEGNMSQHDAKSFILKLKQSNRFHEDIFGVTLRSSEVTGRARAKAEKARSYINSNVMSRQNADRETVTPIPSENQTGPRSKPKAPRSSRYTTDQLLSNGDAFSEK